MSACPTHHSQQRRVRTIAAVAAALTASVAHTGVAAAADVSVVAGNPNCASLGGGLQEHKIDPVPQGANAFAGGSLEITVSGRTLAWRADDAVDAVIVKGGPNAHVYRYSPESSGDEGLTAPINDSNGEPYGLSHISFCSDPGDDTPPPPPPTPGPCEAGGPATMPDGSSCTPPPPPPPPPAPPAPRQDDPPAPPAPRQADPPPVTTVASSGGVLGATGVVAQQRVLASAAMRRPRRCVSRPFRQVLTGRGVRRVTMYVNGRRVRTMAGGRKRYTLRIDPRRYRGVIRVRARVQYVAASGRRPQTLQVTVLRCAAVGAQGVRFTG